MNKIDKIAMKLTDMIIRPVMPKAAWPMSGYVSRPG